MTGDLRWERPHDHFNKGWSGERKMLAPSWEVTVWLSKGMRRGKGGTEGNQKGERRQLIGGRWRKEERIKTSVRGPQAYPQVWRFTKRTHRPLKRCYTHGYVCYGKRMQIKVSKGERCCEDQAQGSQLSSPGGVSETALNSPRSDVWQHID